MELSLKNYTKILPKELVKKAEKNTVRECDEIDKGHFQAYVDEGNDSYDVSITVDKKGAITGSSCDCNTSVAFCRHKTALLLFITGSKKDGEKIKAAKKLSQFEVLLDEVDADKLKVWVKDLLERNKDLELAFMHKFSNQQKQYTPEDVLKLTLDAVKTVVNNRKKLEVSEVKKIVDLWKGIHEMFISQYRANVADEIAFLNFNALVEACETTQQQTITSSKEFNKYLEDLLTKMVQPLHNLENENSWNIATGYFADRMIKDNSKFSVNYLSFLSNLFNISSIDRKKRLADRLAKKYAKNKKQQSYENLVIYTETVFKIVYSAGLFDSYADFFKPLNSNDNYNRKLISALIEYRHLRAAEKYSEEQIGGNYRQESSTIYLHCLKDIYVVEKNILKLIEVLKLLTPRTFDFDDYLFIYEQFNSEEEKKKWRYKVMSSASNKSYENNDARIFPFKLLDYEQKYKKMVEYIDERIPYAVIVKYADKMAANVKKGFLTKLINKPEHISWWRMDPPNEEDRPLFIELLGILEKYYSKREMRLAIGDDEKKGYYDKSNKFVDFMRKNLG